MLRYPNGIWRPGPEWKQGYSAYPSPQPKEGFVLHSMEGSTSAAFGELDKVTRQASWHFSISKDGTVYQHYDPLAVTWHCGLPGDNISWTAAIGNVALIGIEHEGKIGEPLTGPQFRASAAVQNWCYSVIPSLKPPALRSSHWEHGWLSNTSCPSGRIPWTMVMASVHKEENMSQEQVDSILNAIKELKAQVVADAPVYVKVTGFNAVYKLDEEGQTLIHVVNPDIFLAQTPSMVVEYPSAHGIWSLRTIYPAGVPKGLLR